METNTNHLKDVYLEARAYLVGQNKLIDAILPPILFMMGNYFYGLLPALWISLGTAAIITLIRLVRGSQMKFALGGLGAVLAAALLAWYVARAEGFFLPSILINAVLLLATGVSLVLKKPLMALLSRASRKWPLDWYLHPNVMPAYMEVSLVWAALMSIRLVTQIYLYQNHMVNELGVFQIITGNPSTILLLILSYLYGVWRLKMLNGPSVEEFMRGVPPPWNGQKRGF